MFTFHELCIIRSCSLERCDRATELTDKSGSTRFSMFTAPPLRLDQSQSFFKFPEVTHAPAYKTAQDLLRSCPFSSAGLSFTCISSWLQTAASVRLNSVRSSALSPRTRFTLDRNPSSGAPWQWCLRFHSPPPSNSSVPENTP